MSLRVVPLTLRQANAFVAAYHRHHGPSRGCKFCLAVRGGEQLRGVAIVGRPVSRVLDDGLTAEILRVCTDGAANACSMLYGACRKAAFAMGYRRILTYTLPDEGGASLRAAGFVRTFQTDGGSWDRPSRPREDNAPTCPKWRWDCWRESP